MIRIKSRMLDVKGVAAAVMAAGEEAYAFLLDRNSEKTSARLGR